MTIPNATVEGMTDDGDLLVTIPAAFRDSIRQIVGKCIQKHGGFARVSIDGATISNCPEEDLREIPWDYKP